MNEKTLLVIIRFFAVVIPESSVNSAIKESIGRYCARQSGATDLRKFFNYFEEELNSPYIGDDFYKKSIFSTVQEKFTTQERLMLLAMLADMLFVKANEQSRQGHHDLYFEVCEGLGLEQKAGEGMRLFSIAQRPEELPKGQVMVIHEQPVKGDFIYWQFERINAYLCVYHAPVIGGIFVRKIGKGRLFLDNVLVSDNEVFALHKGGFMRLDGSEDIYYTDLIWHFFHQNPPSPFLFEVSHVDFFFPNGHKGLNNIHFTEKHSSLVGIMGLSGAGKTTLVNVLNGNAMPSQNPDYPEGGTVKINGVDIHRNPELVKGAIGYVPQEDALLEKLTVLENLTYSAKLSLSQLKDDEIDRLVMEKLEALSLQEIANLQVGNPLDGGVSGGQRKRLNIAMELLRNPSVLFVDEPTSGLSSRDSDRIMDVLRNLAKGGMLVFVVIHQPSSDIFKSFDRIFILDKGGEQIYHGAPILAVQRIKKYHTARNGAVCEQCGNVEVEDLFEEIDRQEGRKDENGKTIYKRVTAPLDWKRSFQPFLYQVEEAVRDRIRKLGKQQSVSLHVPSFVRQLGIFLKRDVLTKVRDSQYLLITFLQAPVLALALAWVVRYAPIDTEYSYGENINIPSFLFMAVFVALFMGLVQSGEEIHKDRAVLKRESFLNLSNGAYLSSKLVILFSISFMQTLTFVVVSALVLQLPQFGTLFWFSLFTITCLANVLGLIVSSLFASVVTIYISIPILIIPQLLLSGVVVNFNEVNPVLSNDSAVPLVGEIMPSRWAFEGVMVAAFMANDYQKEVYDFEQKNAEAEYYQLYYIPTLKDLIHQLNKTNDTDQFDRLAHELNYLDQYFEGLNQKTVEKVENHEGLSLGERADLEDFLDGVSAYFSQMQVDAQELQQAYLTKRTLGKDKRNAFEAYKKRFYNPTLARHVKATNSVRRIVAGPNRFIQKIYPIYQSPRPYGLLGFRSIMYVPKKYFMGYYISTPIFNALLLWVGTLFFYLLLYTNGIKRLFLLIQRNQD